VAREARLWAWLRDGGAARPTLHMRRVENRVGEGDPDVDGCCAGTYFELELKGCDRPVRGGRLDFEVRQAQLLYHRRRHRCGGNNWFYVRVGRDRETARYLVPGDGDSARRLQDGVTETELLAMAVLPPDHGVEELLRRIAPPNDGSAARD